MLRQVKLTGSHSGLRRWKNDGLSSILRDLEGARTEEGQEEPKVFKFLRYRYETCNAQRHSSSLLTLSVRGSMNVKKSASGEDWTFRGILFPSLCPDKRVLSSATTFTTPPGASPTINFNPSRFLQRVPQATNNSKWEINGGDNVPLAVLWNSRTHSRICIVFWRYSDVEAVGSKVDRALECFADKLRSLGCIRCTFWALEV